MFDVSLDSLVLYWRTFFMVNAASEFAILYKCLMIFKDLEGERQTDNSVVGRYLFFIQTTCAARVGIVATLVIKYLDIIPTEHLKIYHMTFVVFGLAMYNKKMRASAQKVRGFAGSLGGAILKGGSEVLKGGSEVAAMNGKDTSSMVQASVYAASEFEADDDK
jgi:hypothetical protein